MLLTKMNDQHSYEISGRFRDAVLARIERLEMDADQDAQLIPELLDPNHQKRQAELVAMQLEEAVRLRARLTFSAVSAHAVWDILGRQAI